MNQNRLTETDVCCIYNKYHSICIVTKYRKMQKQIVVITLDTNSRCLVEVDHCFTSCINTLIKNGYLDKNNDKFRRKLLTVLNGKVCLVIVMLIDGIFHNIYIFNVYQSDLIKKDFILAPYIIDSPSAEQTAIIVRELREYTDAAFFKSMVLKWIKSQDIPIFQVVLVVFSNNIEYIGIKFRDLIEYLKRYIISDSEIKKIENEYLQNEDKQFIFVSTEKMGRLYYVYMFLPY